MNTAPKPLPNPSAADLQAVQQLLHAGQAKAAERRIRPLLANYPKSLALYNLLGVAQQLQGKQHDAIASFKQLLAIDSRIAEIHFNLGVLLTEINQPQEAINYYRQAVQLKPNFTPAHFNLGALLQAEGALADAARHYQQALALEPNFVEALGNLGTVLQQQGQLQAAEQCYRRALAINSDARGHFNLGTVLYDQGAHQAAIPEFRAAIALDPQFADAWNSLGETFRDQGDMDEAVKCYRRAIAIDAQHDRAHYNLGEFLCLAGRLQEAIAYFEQSAFADAAERVLQCLYKTQQFELFKQKFDQLTTQQQHTSTLLGTLATHYATNFRVADTYQFCPTPMDYVVHTRIDELAENDSPLLQELLCDIQTLAIAERKQGRLYYGMQSAGNLLQRAEPSIQKLASLIRAKIADYQQRFADSEYSLIRHFPSAIEFSSSWYLRMQQGGYLTSHIHEEGWISGCVYLKLPEKCDQHEGSFAYSTDGDDYPRLHDDFPSNIVDQQVGDLVLFPSSLFHRTLPFHSEQERVCVAFDVKPLLT